MSTDKKPKKSVDEPKATEPKITVTQDEKILFYKAMLSDQPFKLSEPLLGGALTVEFQALSVAAQMEVYDQLKKDQFNNLLTNDSNYLTALTCYRLALSLTTINGTDWRTAVAEKESEEDKESSLVTYSKQVKAWPVFKVSAVTEAFKKFEDKIVELTNAVMDPSFWEAAK